MSDWIKVSDRLPEPDTLVLCTSEFFGAGDWRCAVGAIDRNNNYCWWLKGASWTPTHWQPLPSPPTE
ncbi:DUF551 domain-containing protein [Pseudomonas sp. RC4D1]|nr:DUF551 domain-containing protein [Pseudomonas sp. RC4D1]